MQSIAQWLNTLVKVGLYPGSASVSYVTLGMWFNLAEMHLPHLKQPTSQSCCKNKMMRGKHVAQSIYQTVNKL